MPRSRVRVFGVLTRYQIVSVFPDGWLTTGQISRDGLCAVQLSRCIVADISSVTVSVIKKKSEKEDEE